MLLKALISQIPKNRCKLSGSAPSKNVSREVLLSEESVLVVDQDAKISGGITCPGTVRVRFAGSDRNHHPRPSSSIL